MEFVRGQVIINIVWILENGGVICASLGVRGGRWYLDGKGGDGGTWATPEKLLFVLDISYNLIMRCNTASP